MNRATTSAWGHENAIPAQSQVSQIAAIQNAAQPATDRSLIGRAKALWPYVAGGFVILAIIKLLYEKYVVRDETELRGLRIGWYNFIVVGVMALVFELGAQTVAGGIAQVKNKGS